jgi:excisionase family DNA binding protein
MAAEVRLTVGVRAAARELGVGINSLYRAIRVGSVRVLRVGKKVRIPRAELEALAREPERFSRGEEGAAR